MLSEWIKRKYFLEYSIANPSPQKERWTSTQFLQQIDESPHKRIESLTISDGPSSRRAFFEKGAAALATGAAIASSPAAANAYSVPDLPYPFEALEPYIDTPTMK